MVRYFCFLIKAFTNLFTCYHPWRAKVFPLSFAFLPFLVVFGYNTCFFFLTKGAWGFCRTSTTLKVSIEETSFFTGSGCSKIYLFWGGECSFGFSIGSWTPSDLQSSGSVCYCLLFGGNLQFPKSYTTIGHLGLCMASLIAILRQLGVVLTECGYKPGFN